MPRNPLKPRLPPRNKVTGRRNKKRYKGQKHEGFGEKMRALWQDPEYRAKMAERDRVRLIDQKLNPLKYQRNGVPDGMTKKMVKPLWDRAYQLADQFIQVMKDNGELPPGTAIPDTDAGKAEAALREVFALAVGPTDNKIKIQALNTVLAYTKSKPESKSKLTLDKAEDFLSEVARDLKPE